MHEHLTAENLAREQICQVGHSLFSRGYVHATAGNISVRLEDGYLITPTDACMGDLEPGRLAKLDLGGDQVSGDRASKTITLHRTIYESTARTGRAARCIIHTHSTAAVTCSLRAHALDAGVADGTELLPPITPYFVMKVGHVPHIPYHRPGAPESAARVRQAIEGYAKQGIHLRAVMLAKLGPNVWNDTPASAMAVLEELEETARLFLQAPALALSEQELAELRQAFNCEW